MPRWSGSTTPSTRPWSRPRPLSTPCWNCPSPASTIASCGSSSAPSPSAPWLPFVGRCGCERRGVRQVRALPPRAQALHPHLRLGSQGRHGLPPLRAVRLLVHQRLHEGRVMTSNFDDAMAALGEEYEAWEAFCGFMNGAEPSDTVQTILGPRRAPQPTYVVDVESDNPTHPDHAIFKAWVALQDAIYERWNRLESEAITRDLEHEDTL